MVKTLLSCTLLLIIFSAVNCNNSSQAGEYDLYVIRSMGLHAIPMVLDAQNSSAILLEEFTGSSTQLWRFENAVEPGLFYIINMSDDSLALDCVSDRLYLYTRTDYRYQHWFIRYDGSITNMLYRQNIAVEASPPKFHVGSRIIIEEEDPQSEYQKFVLMKMN